MARQSSCPTRGQSLSTPFSRPVMWSVMLYNGLGASLETPSITTNPAISRILQNIPEVFQDPPPLPSSRATDPFICLKEGTNPISERAYGYNYFQKNEIEKLVQEMLSACLIQPSTSPFSSPVILVKKNDGSWCFCVDYRSLNDATIPDKYLFQS